MTGVQAPEEPVDEPTGIVASRARHEPQHRRASTSLRNHPSRRWMIGFVGTMAVILVLAAGLAYVGISTVRTSRAGRVISTITDPAAPGFEALVEPSPTLVVLDQTPEGALGSAAVISLNSADQGGAVLLVPLHTQTVRKKPWSLSAAYTLAKSPDDVRSDVEDITTLGISEIASVDADRWAELVAPVAPLLIDNPKASPAFPAGPIQLQADQVAAWLHTPGPGETDLDLVQRQELFWKAWAKAVGASTAAAPVPGEVDSGLGRFVRGLARGATRVEPVPVTPEVNVDGNLLYLPDLEATRALVNQVVPFPGGTASLPRVRVRLLDGTGDQQRVSDVAPMLIPADAEIVVAGNARRFGYTTTEVRFHNPLVKEQAEALHEALGAGKLIDDPRPTEAFDVTIIIGSDV